MTKHKPRIVIIPTERQWQMIEEIQNDRGFATKVQVLTDALAQTHSKYFPAYLAGKYTGSPAEQQKQKELAKEETAKLIAENKQKERIRLCEINLEGDVVGDSCKYYRYSGNKRYEMTIPLNLLDEKIVEGQYSPSKERVELLQKQKKTDY